MLLQVCLRFKGRKKENGLAVWVGHASPDADWIWVGNQPMRSPHLSNCRASVHRRRDYAQHGNDKHLPVMAARVTDRLWSLRKTDRRFPVKRISMKCVLCGKASIDAKVEQFPLSPEACSLYRVPFATPFAFG